MLPIAFIGFVLVIAILVYYFVFAPPSDTKTLIKIKKGEIYISKGSISMDAKVFIKDMLEEDDVKSGFIAITHERRVVFSSNIPKSSHQRLRNILLN